MTGRMYSLAGALVASLLLGGCRGSHESIFATPPTTPTPNPPSTFVNGLRLFPAGVLAGSPSQGTVTLALPAPPGGVLVTLSSTGAVSLPGSVTVPAGAMDAQFDITTMGVSADAEATVTASGLGATRSASLRLWTIRDTFLYWASEADTLGLQGGGGAAMLPGPPSRFTGICSSNVYSFTIDPFPANPWRLSFAASNAPLRVGAYEATSSFPPVGGGYFTYSGPGFINCGPYSARFVVREVQLGRGGAVRRFSATFEETCPRTTQTSARRLVGELRVTNADTLGSSGTCTP